MNSESANGLPSESIDLQFSSGVWLNFTLSTSHIVVKLVQMQIYMVESDAVIYQYIVFL